MRTCAQKGIILAPPFRGPLDSVSAIERPPAEEKWNRKPIATSPTTSKSSRLCSARSWWTIARWSASPRMLKPEHFYDPLHGRIFEVMRSGRERGGMVLTPLTLHAAMKADPGLIEIGGQAYLAGLAQAAPAMPNVRDYARILHDLAVRRSLIRIGEDIVNTAYEAPHEKPPKAQIEEAEKALYRVSESAKYGEGPMDFAESLRRAVEMAEQAQARGGRISGVTSGFTDIDRLLGGLQPSDLLILAGRPGMGKTSLATNMAFHAARAYVEDMEAGAELPRGAPVLFFSLEMAAQQLRPVFCPSRPKSRCGKSATASSPKANGRNSSSPCRTCPRCRFTSTIPAASPSPRSRPAPGA